MDLSVRSHAGIQIPDQIRLKFGRNSISCHSAGLPILIFLALPAFCSICFIHILFIITADGGTKIAVCPSFQFGIRINQSMLRAFFKPSAHPIQLWKLSQLIKNRTKKEDTFRYPLWKRRIIFLLSFLQSIRCNIQDDLLLVWTELLLRIRSLRRSRWTFLSQLFCQLCAHLYSLCIFVAHSGNLFLHRIPVPLR